MEANEIVWRPLALGRVSADEYVVLDEAPNAATALYWSLVADIMGATGRPACGWRVIADRGGVVDLHPPGPRSRARMT